MRFLLLGLLFSSTALSADVCVPQNFSHLNIGARAVAAFSNEVPPGALKEITQEMYDTFPRVMSTRPIKFVLLPDAKGEFTRLMVIDPTKHNFHWQFLSTLPEFKGMSMKEIQTISLDAKDRRVLLGTLTTKDGVSEGHWNSTTSFFLSTNEAPDPALVRQVQGTVDGWLKKNANDVVTGAGSLGSKLGFEPTLRQRDEVAKRIKDYSGVTVHMPFAHEGALTYNEGLGVGKIVVAKTAKEVEAGIANGTIGPDTILVVGEDLLELPPVAGVISANPLTEGSHLVLLAQMYGMPLVHEPGAIKAYSGLKNKHALLESREGSGFEIFSPLSENDLARVRAIVKKPSMNPKSNFDETRIREAADLSDDEVKAYGGKSTKFGLIRRTIPESTQAKVMGIPIHYYKKFLETSTLPDGRTVKQALDAIMLKLPKEASYFEVAAASNEVLSMMKTAKMDPGMVKHLRETLEKEFPGAERLKLRSSSNVEDGAEFNGAGLYESEGICLRNCKKDDFEKGLLKVWSSLYTERGLWARRRFGVDESQVGMGITVHPSYKGEAANGVVKFGYRPKYEGEAELEKRVQILGVAGEEESVTNAKQGGVNELLEMVNGEVRNHRTANGEAPGRFLMDKKHYDQLDALMAKLHKAWPSDLKQMEIEAEWKLVGEGPKQHVELKQVRVVPKPATTILEGNKYMVVNGENLALTGNWPDDAISMLSKPQKIDFPMDGNEFAELAAGKPLKNPVKMAIAGKEYSLKAGKPTLREEYGYQVIDMPLEPLDASMPGYKPIKATIRLRRGSGSGILTPNSPNFRLTLEMGDREIGEVSRFDLEDLSKESSIMTKESRPEKFAFKKEGCPMKVNAKSSHRFLKSDNEFRILESAEVGGLLSRPLKISGEPNAFYFKQLHEEREEMVLDILSDPSLTADEKKKISKATGGARYLKATMGGFLFLDSALKAVKGIKGCADEYEIGGEEAG